MQADDEQVVLPGDGEGAGGFGVGDVVGTEKGGSGDLGATSGVSQGVGTCRLFIAGFEGDAVRLFVEEQLHVGDGFFLELFHASAVKVKVPVLHDGNLRFFADTSSCGECFKCHNEFLWLN